MVNGVKYHARGFGALGVVERALDWDWGWNEMVMELVKAHESLKLLQPDPGGFLESIPSAS